MLFDGCGNNWRLLCDRYDGSVFFVQQEKLSGGDKGCHEYILKPVSATARLQRNCLERPLNSRRSPRINCSIELDQIPLELSDSQFQCILSSLRCLHQVTI